MLDVKDIQKHQRQCSRATPGGISVWIQFLVCNICEYANMRQCKCHENTYQAPHKSRSVARVEKRLKANN